MTRPPGPFNIPKFDFRVSAFAGNAPMRVMFQPLVKSGIASFEWDFDGDGVFEAKTPGAISYEYKEPGEYMPVAMATFKDGDVVTVDGDTIEVANDTPEILEVPVPPVGINDSWDTARRLHLKDMVVQTSVSIDVFKFACHTTRLYRISLMPATFTVPDGLELRVLSRSGHFVASSGGLGRYGWLLLQLGDHKEYQIQVVGQGSYGLVIEKADLSE